MIENYKNWGYALMRISLGLIFLFYGLGKFMKGPNAFAETMVGQFAKTPLPPEPVRLFGMTLPFIEVTVGALVLLGLFTRAALVLASLLLMALTVGVIFLDQPQVVAQNLLFSLSTFFLIFYSEYNAFAVDDLWHRHRGLPSRKNSGNDEPDGPGYGHFCGRLNGSGRGSRILTATATT
ncbi:MAG TPA: DoxX family protein [Blastocatellia bacterium]|nr:DoxX family protein [Blastocatellia bacterium]